MCYLILVIHWSDSVPECHLQKPAAGEQVWSINKSLLSLIVHPENEDCDLAIRQHRDADRGSNYCACMVLRSNADSALKRDLAPVISPVIGSAASSCHFPCLFPIHSFLLTEIHSQGFDEFMNVVVDEAAEVYLKDAKPRRELGTYACLSACRLLTLP
jgi:hypothetical protein